MTHSTVNTELENQGNKDVAYHEINITSLDVAGEEGYNPSNELNLEGEDRYGIGVRGQTNVSVAFGYNSTSGNVTARMRSDDQAVPSGSDVGHVTLEVVGE